MPKRTSITPVGPVLCPWCQRTGEQRGSAIVHAWGRGSLAGQPTDTCTRQPDGTWQVSLVNLTWWPVV